MVCGWCVVVYGCVGGWCDLDLVGVDDGVCDDYWDGVDGVWFW